MIDEPGAADGQAEERRVRPAESTGRLELDDKSQGRPPTSWRRSRGAISIAPI